MKGEIIAGPRSALRSARSDGRGFRRPEAAPSGALPPPRPQPRATRASQPPRPGPWPPGRPGAGPPPAGPPTHRCSAPRRSDRASGRCALRRQTDGCGERMRMAAGTPGPSDAPTHRLRGRWSPPALPWRRRQRRQRGGRAGGAMDGVDQDRTGRLRGSASSLRATPAHARAPARPALRARPIRRARPRARASLPGNRKPGSPEACGCCHLDGSLARPTSFLLASSQAGISLTQFPHLRNGRNIWGSAADWVTFSRFILLSTH